MSFHQFITAYWHLVLFVLGSAYQIGHQFMRIKWLESEVRENKGDIKTLREEVKNLRVKK